MFKTAEEKVFEEILAEIVFEYRYGKKDCLLDMEILAEAAVSVGNLNVWEYIYSLNKNLELLENSSELLEKAG